MVTTTASSSLAAAANAPLAESATSMAMTWWANSLAWPALAWAAQMEAMRIGFQASRPAAWAQFSEQLLEQWACARLNGAIPA